MRSQSDMSGRVTMSWSVGSASVSWRASVALRPLRRALEAPAASRAHGSLDLWGENVSGPLPRVGSASVRPLRRALEAPAASRAHGSLDLWGENVSGPLPCGDN